MYFFTNVSMKTASGRFQINRRWLMVLFGGYCEYPNELK